MSTHWEAGDYERVASPQRTWAKQLFSRLNLRGTERVLDAGCGSGGITAQLAEILAAGEVVGIDSSEEMIAHARASHPTLDLRHGDLLELDFDEAFDAVFSNAVFHWIPDHERLFAGFARALRSGGRIEAQCGGEGNVATVKAVIDELALDPTYSAHLDALVEDWHFARPAETEARLDAAGFIAARAWLEEMPVAPPEPRAYLETVCLRQPLELLPPELQAEFVEAVMQQLGESPTLDYVRLNISARKP